MGFFNERGRANPFPKNLLKFVSDVVTCRMQLTVHGRGTVARSSLHTVPVAVSYVTLSSLGWLVCIAFLAADMRVLVRANVTFLLWKQLWPQLAPKQAGNDSIET